MKKCLDCDCDISDNETICVNCQHEALTHGAELFEFYYGNGDNCRSDYKEGEI